ncbi:MAG: hypothetical protein M0Q51_08010 [Bacteroidales bacterium]|nr:hypothetical protein [Bacteroidales bacterium]
MITKILKRNFLIYLISISILVFSGYFSYGQGQNEEVTIIAPYIPSISDATKIPFRPEITPGEQDTPSFEYDYVTKRLETRLELDPVEPMKFSEGEQDEIYRNYAKVGFGNYTTPYLEFMASSLRSEKYQFGARLKHHSSQGKIKGYPPSGYSHNLISVYGKTFSKNHTLSADIGYNRDVVHFYGFVPDNFPDVQYSKDDIRQRFQHLQGNAEYSSNYKEKYKLNHLFRLGLHYFSDFYGTRESQVSFITDLDKGFKTIGNDFKHSFALDLGLDYLNYKDSISSSNPLFILIRPIYRFGFGQYRFEAGLNINIAAGSSANQTTMGMDAFPVLKAEVVIIDEKLKAFAEVSGNRSINSFRSLAGINPFMTSTPLIYYTDERIKIGGGITGNAGGLNFLAEAYYSYLNDMPLFVTDTSLVLQNKFDVIYEDINLLKIKASLGYMQVNQFSARLMAAYYHYIPKDEVKAWQMPNFEIGLDAGYTLMEKYTIRASVLALGSKYARTFEAGEVVPVKVSGAFDLGLGFEYQVNKMISAYIDASNILNQHYQRWYQYPVQGIQMMAGVKLTF